jgi:trk system potassium uptake protein TrkH
LIGVDVGSALDLVGGVLKWVGAAYVVPLAVALGYGDPILPFLLGGVVTAGAGHALDQFTGPKSGAAVGPREGFLVVALIWLLVPVFGMLPYLLGDVDQLSSPVDAFFESVSGFTATGATLVTDVDALDRSMLFWRQFSHWLGGMGIVILAVAVLPRLRIGGRQLLQSELAGPTEIERFGETVRETARRLWTLYAGLTVVAILALAATGWLGLDPAMTLFDAVGYAFSVVSLGGFATRNTSAADFAAVTQWLLLLLMIIAGINFLRLYSVVVQRRFRMFAADEELRLYLAFAVVGSALVIFELLARGTDGGAAAIRHGSFQAVAVMTTAGFGTTDSSLWGPLATMTLLLLMFVGASAGSTSGSIKVVRHLLLFKLVRRELEHAVHREVVVPIRAGGGVVEERALRSTVVFVLIYVLAFAIGCLALLVDSRGTGAELAMIEAIGASAACIGNVGVAFGFAGPFGSYAPFSDLSTMVLALLMWIGRVEIIPVAVLLSRNYWRS